MPQTKHKCYYHFVPERNVGQKFSVVSSVQQFPVEKKVKFDSCR